MATVSKFKKIRTVTAGILKFSKGVPRYLFTLSPMYVGKKLEEGKEPATLMYCVDMETGEEGIVLCPAVLRNELQENYAGESYVRKGFEIIVTNVTGAKYHHVSVAEVAPPDDFEAPANVNPAGCNAETIAAAKLRKAKGDDASPAAKRAR